MKVNLSIKSLKEQIPFLQTKLNLLLILLVAKSLPIALVKTEYPRDFEILGWGPAGPVLPHGEKVPL